jgi:hypothetical protein
MPKPRQRRPAGGAEMPLGVELNQWLWLVDEFDEEPEGSWWIWHDHGAAATEYFVKRHPGERPREFWRSCELSICHRCRGETDYEFIKRSGRLIEGEADAVAALTGRARAAWERRQRDIADERDAEDAAHEASYREAYIEMLRQSSWLRKTRPEEFLKYGLVDEPCDITPASPKTQAQ